LALTRRGKTLVTVVVVAALGAGVLAFTGHGPAPLQKVVGALTGKSPDPPPPTCPLTGRTLPGDKPPPNRPVLAVKVENTSEAYPLAGLDKADIIYEEAVEGGLTRFIALFNCADAARVGPVRSARTTDPKILLQFSAHPLLAFSGAAPQVLHALDLAKITQLVEGDPADAFTRDSSRQVPHNLFAATGPLWAAGKKLHKDEPAPRPAFVYSSAKPTGGHAHSSVTIEFSTAATADWRWQQGHWVRFMSGSPMTLEDGSPIAADNIVIQQVQVAPSAILDVTGLPSPEVTLTGSGRVWILRDGVVIPGTWSRHSVNDATSFKTKSGAVIALKPGTTFVELAPQGMFNATITFGKG
jgi:hypothetical protein